MTFSLVIMAAGLGSRFGGTKQLAEVGPNGEAFFDFAIRDSVAAGARDVVVIVRTEIEADVRAHLARHHGSGVMFRFVRQDAFGPPRQKPWGTAHAVLSVRDSVELPFVVVNADDYYGQSSYQHVADRLGELSENRAFLVGFELDRTLPSTGSVSRGVCQVDANGRLVSIVETHGIERRPDGQITSLDPPGALSGTTPVSMNMWGFSPALFASLERRFDDFLTRFADDPKSECLLPGVVGDMTADGELTVDVVTTEDDWIGVTNPDDLEPARAILAARS